MGRSAFSQKYSAIPSGETMRRISKKLHKCKNGAGLFYHHGEYGGARTSRAAGERKCSMF